MNKLANLKKIYPEFFKDNFYFKCDNRWYELVNLVCKCFQNYKEYFNILQFAQIKEKFGLLRIYFERKPIGKQYQNIIQIQNFINSIEEMSSIVCEKCGQIKTDKRDVCIKILRGFYKKTLCDKCLNKFNKKEKQKCTSKLVKKI